MALPLGCAVLVGAAATQRIVELAWSAHCVHRLRARGARQISGDRGGAWSALVLVHLGLLVLPVAEVLWLAAHAPRWLFWIASSAYGLAQLLRLWAILSVGQRWNVRAEVFPAEGFTTRGPYRWIAHPNYLAVLIDFSALPLALGAWRSWILLNLVHVPLLAARIRREEHALAALQGWSAAFAGKRRFLPGRRRAGLAESAGVDDTSGASSPPPVP